MDIVYYFWKAYFYVWGQKMSNYVFNVESDSVWALLAGV